MVLAEDGGAAEKVPTRSLEAAVEAFNEVAGHESQGELVIVLILDLPDGVLVEGNVLPEPLEGISLIVVGVVALQIVESEGGFGQGLKRVLGLGGLSRRLLSGLGGSLGSGLLLGLLGLLGSNVGELGGIEEFELGRNSRVNGLVVDGLIPTRDVGVLLTPLLVEEKLEATGDDGGGKQISESDALADEVGVVLEVLLDGGNGLRGQLGSVVNVLLVVGVTADQGTVPLAENRQDLGLEFRRLAFVITSKKKAG